MSYSQINITNEPMQIVHPVFSVLHHSYKQGEKCQTKISITVTRTIIIPSAQQSLKLREC